MSRTEEEQKKFEDDFKYLINKYIEYLAYFSLLISKETRTPQEEQDLQVVQQLLINMGNVLSSALKSMSDDLFGKALDLYYHYKDFAAMGNKDAQHLMKELKPLLAATLNSRINKN